jgi:hypothetical protein
MAGILGQMNGVEQSRGTSAGAVEYGALLFLSFGALLGSLAIESAAGSVVALVVCAAGIVLLWRSDIWTTVDKALGTALLPIGFWVISLIHVVDGLGSSNDFVHSVSGALVIFVLVTDVLVSFFTLIYLMVRLYVGTQRNRGLRPRTSRQSALR